MDTAKQIQKETGLTLQGRENLSVYGVEDVVSFDEISVYLITSGGNLTVEGENLHISVLDVANGKLQIDGHIDSLVYQDNVKKEKSGFFTKLFK